MDKSPRTEFYYWRMAELHAVRSGKWKLHVKQTPPVVYWNKYEMERPELYEVESDLSEQYDRYLDEPEIVEKLLQNSG